MQTATIDLTHAKTHARYYDSTAEMAAAVADVDAPIVRTWMFNDSHWVGRSFADFNQVAEAVKTLWPEGMKVYSQLKADLDKAQLPQPSTIRRRKTWDEADGDEFDLDRFRSGQAAWRQTCRQHNNGPTSITLSVQVGGNCTINSSDLLWTPAAAVALADLLETAGYSVRIIGVSQARNVYKNGDSSTTVVTLKEAGTPVDTSALINSLSGWCFRTIWVSERDLGSVQSKSKVNDNYGFTSAVSVLAPEQVDTDFTGATEFFAVPIVYDRGSALATVRSVLAKIEKQMTL